MISGERYRKIFNHYPPENDIKEWDAWAPSYDKEVDYLLGINDNVICSKISFEEKNVLDLGCGTGRFAGVIAQKARHVTTLDFSSKMLKETRKRLKDFHNISFEKIDIEKMALSLNEKFDVIVAISLMHHIGNTKHVVKKLKSYLAKNGQIVIVDSLSDRDKKDRYLFNSNVIRNCGVLRWLRFLSNTYFDTRLRRHTSKEDYITYEHFKNRYKLLLPRAEVEIINGIFALLIWHNTRDRLSMRSKTSKI